VWSGFDRVGNAIVLTQGAFGMEGRQHVWRKRRQCGAKEDRPVWDLVADNRGEISASGRIWHQFKATIKSRSA
jgi:hypothetical protein